MLLGEVDFPEEVLSAHERGRLVIFVGAGASKSPPSMLPLFAGLAREVARKLGSSRDPDSEEWRDRLDVFMGELDDEPQADVHALVQGIIGRADSRPNQNHDALSRVAAAGKVRVVTTNYDLHLEQRLRERVPDLPVYQAPALPLGNDFEGLVYLHGSVNDEPRRLIVTDRDFAGAYFNDAWATRFLQSMFKEYVVLFVGYSHDDMVMKYVGLGVGRDAMRFALTASPHDPLWDRLGVKSLGYPTGQDHEPLTSSLVQWANLCEMGLLDHRQRIRTVVTGFVASSTSQTPEGTVPPAELSYLAASINRPDRVAFFCEFAREKAWLEWISTRPAFMKMFDPIDEGSRVTDALADWFAKHYAFGEPPLVESAWRAVELGGGTVGSSLWNSLAFQLHSHQDPRTPLTLSWLRLLMEQERPGCHTDFLDYGFDWKGLWEDRRTALALLEHLMDPRLVPEASLGSPRLRVQTRGKLYWLDKAWSERFHPEIDSILFDVLPVVERALTRHLEFEELAYRSRYGITVRRSRIAADSDVWNYREAVDAVVDAVRDCLVALWVADLSAAQSLVSRWATSGLPLLVRIAVHGVTVTEHLDADSKVQFLIDHDLILGPDGTWPEVWRLLSLHVPHASRAVMEEVLQACVGPFRNARDEYHALWICELLEANGLVSARLPGLLESMRLRLGEDSQPAELEEPKRLWGHSEFPESVEEFRQRVMSDPSSAAEYLTSFPDDVTFPTGYEPTREGALGLLREAVKCDPELGLILWPWLADNPDARARVISSWGHTTDRRTMDGVLTALLSVDLGAFKHDVGQFLIWASRSEARWDECSRTDELIDRIWEACETSEVFRPRQGKDWLMQSLNTTAGELVDFWFHVFHRRWVKAGDKRTELPRSDRDFLETALGDRTERGAEALTQIASRLHYLDAADSEWCRRHLQPMGDWSNPAIAEPFWWGALSHARWSDRLVKNGLLDGLLETAGHLDDFGNDQRLRWSGLLASIAVRCSDPPPDSWLDTFTTRTEPDDRKNWLRALVEEMEDLDSEGRSMTWTSWLREYWAKRSSSDPIRLDDRETEVFAQLAPLVPQEAFPDAVALVLQRDVGLGSHANVCDTLSSDLLKAQPAETGRFLAHLMRCTSTVGFWGAEKLRPWLDELVSMPGEWTEVKNAALQLGIRLD